MDKPMIRRIYRPIIRKLLAVFFLLFAGWSGSLVAQGSSTAEPVSGAGGILLLESPGRHYDPVNPWTIPQIQERKGLAFVAGKNWILTDLDLVRDPVSITLTNPATGVHSEARILHAAFDAGIAILEPEQPAILEGLNGYPLLDRDVKPGDSLQIQGISEKDRGFVYQELRVASFRKELLDGSDVDLRNLFFVTAGPLGGNFTGAPVLLDGKLAGLYHMPGEEGGRQYGLPVSVLNHVFQDVADQVYDGFPVLDMTLQPVDNVSFRRYTGMEGEAGGLYIDRIAYDHSTERSNPLRPGDVLIKFNGLDLIPGGRIRVRENESVGFQDYLSTLQKGTVPVEVLRMGRIYREELQIRPSPRQARMRRPLESRRSYFLSGGLVFQNLDRPLVRSERLPLNPLTRLYRYEYSLVDGFFDPEKSDVVLTSVLDDIRTSEYPAFLGGIVESINGQPVNNLKDFIHKWEAVQTRYIRIEFVDEKAPLVLERDSIDEINRRIEERYRARLQEDGREH